MTVYFRVPRVAIVATLAAVVSTPVAGQTSTSRADQAVAARQAANPDTNAQATALAEFQKRLQDYINLRAELVR
jgi:FlaG/FlaF family flagellin (archaellin)